MDKEEIKKLINKDKIKDIVEQDFPEKTNREKEKMINIIYNTIVECFEVSIPVYKKDKNYRVLAEGMIDDILQSCLEDYNIDIYLPRDKFFEIIDNI